MPKFYVESGSFRGIVDSFDAETAAVWAVHRVMEPSRIKLDVTEDMERDASEIGLFRLEDDIRISERGHGRKDAISIPTHHAFARWAQLILAIDRLTDLLDDHTL
ncbi:MAG: hypothetical protein MUF23_01455 [Pirellula sp.]|jgi:hypothetical protein|nr:hypothetical protein [Pirellula sp.]